MKIRILEILKEKGKTKYWLYSQLGLSYQNFNKIINNKTNGIKFENLKNICEILECTPNDLFEQKSGEFATFIIFQNHISPKIQNFFQPVCAFSFDFNRI